MTSAMRSDAFPGRRLRVFVATQRAQVPPDIERFVYVDGSLEGAVATWDHHRTGERINLDSMPPRIDLAALALDAVGTTMADTDAMASVVAVMAGGEECLPRTVREVLRAASVRCDHLQDDPAASEDANRLGRGLHGWVVEQLRPVIGKPGPEVTPRFSDLCGLVADRIAGGAALPFSTRALDEALASVHRAIHDGLVRVEGPVACVDRRGRDGLDIEALYSVLDSPVAVLVDAHHDGGPRYTVGVNRRSPTAPSSIRPALVALAQAEFAHGPPCRAVEPVPGAENWGGRETVFGSPWNYGSRLAPGEVVTIVRRALE